MKKNKNLKIIAIVAITFQVQSLSAQWQIQPNTTGRFLRVSNVTHSVGVGNFGGLLGAGLVPLSALHVNTNTMISTPNFTAGEVFRTTATDANLNAWRLFTGTGNGTEKFNINVPASSNDVNLSTVQSGFMAFSTNSLERMRITPTGFVGVNTTAPEATLDVNGTIKITALACENCLVTTDEEGNLSTQENTIALLEQRIKQLEEQLTKLQEQLLTMK